MLPIKHSLPRLARALPLSISWFYKNHLKNLRSIIVKYIIVMERNIPRRFFVKPSRLCAYYQLNIHPSLSSVKPIKKYLTMATYDRLVDIFNKTNW